MADPSPKNEYGVLEQVQRPTYLQWADDIARLTLWTLRPSGNDLTRPYTQLGTSSVRSLAASMHRITMPPQVKWLKLDPTPEAEESLPAVQTDMPDDPGNAVRRELDEVLSDHEDNMLKDLRAMMAKSKFAAAIRRNLVEGNTAVHVGKEQIRIFPLRNFVAMREGGDVVKLVLREELLESLDPSHAPQRDEERNWLYTLVDYENGEVWQQATTEEAAERVDGVSTKEYFVFVGNVPDIDHYAVGFAYEHIGIISEINHLSSGLGDASAAAAWNVPVLAPGSTITPAELRGHASGEPLVGNIADVQWLNSGVKIADWSFVANYRITLREELAAIFALGIKDRVAKAATATEILQIASEIDTHTQDLLTAYEETLQRPLAEAMMHHHGLDQIRMPGGGDAIQLLITTGQNALQREAGMSRMLQSAQVVQALDPTMRVYGVRVMEALGNAMQFETGGFFGEAQPQAAAVSPETAMPDESSQGGGPQPQQPGSPNPAA